MRSKNQKRAPVQPQPSNNEAMGQRKLLDGAQSKVKSRAETPYERRISKPASELFPISYPTIEYFIQDKERLFLSAAHSIARTMLNAENFVPGDYKVLFKPASGGQAAFISESLAHRDLVGLMLMQGEHNGDEVRVIEMRYKKKASVAQKGVELELGEPRMKAAMGSATVADALASLHDALGDPAICPMKKEKLSGLLSALEAERHGQEKMFYEACGNSTETTAKARELLAEISAAVRALNSARRHLSDADSASGACTEANEGAGALGKAKALISSLTGDRDRNMSIGAYAGALDLWPFQKDFMKGKETPGHGAGALEAFYDSLPQGSRSQLGYISRDYILEVLPAAMGVGLLEHTAIDSMGHLQSLLRLIHAKTPPGKEGPLLEKIHAMDARFIDIHEMVRGISRELGEVSLNKEKYGSRQWFLKLCSFMETRRKLLGELCFLEKIADGLEHEAPYRSQVKKIIANMAFNLCRVGASEHQLLGGFLENRQVQSELKGMPEFKSGGIDRLRGSMKAFIAAARQESERAGQYLPGGNGNQAAEGHPGRRKFKEEKALADEAIHAKILELREVAPALGGILLSDYRRSKSHVSYKQGETISESPENHLTRMRIAQRLYRLTGEQKHSDAAEAYMDEASRLFALLWSNHRSRSSIIATVRPSCYFQEKGFDIVGAPEKHIERKNTQSELQVEYRLVYEKDTAVLAFSYGGKEHALGASAASQYSTGYLPMEYGESEKDIRTDIYGTRVSLVSLVPPGTGKNPYDLFRGICLAAMAHPEKFDEIRNDVVGKNMENSRFLSTLVAARHRHSGNVAKFGDVLVENLPLKINASGASSFEAYLASPAHYPDFAQSSEEARRFALQQIARRVLASLAVNKWGFVQEYIKGVLADGSEAAEQQAF